MPPSKYLCLTGSEPYDFLDVHRMDKEIRKAMKGMNEAQKKAYLMEYMGWTDEEPNQEGTDLLESTEWEKDYPFE